MMQRRPTRPSLAARLAVALVLPAAALVLPVAGCGGGLLSRDEYIQALMEQNRELQDDLLAAQEKVAQLRAAGARPQPIPKAAEDPYRAVAVRFGRYTAALDTTGDGQPDRLKVVLEPLDAEGDVVKRAGRLELETLVPTEGDAPPRPYHTWTFPQDELAQTWIGSLGIRAYVLKLKWPNGRRPQGKALLLRARFATLAGETLTAETTVPLQETP